MAFESKVTETPELIEPAEARRLAEPPEEGWELRQIPANELGGGEWFAIFEDGDQAYIDDGHLIGDNCRTQGTTSSVPLEIVDRLRALDGTYDGLFSRSDLQALILEAESNMWEFAMHLLETEIGGPMIRTRAEYQKKRDAGEMLLNLDQAIADLRDRTLENSFESAEQQPSAEEAT